MPGSAPGERRGGRQKGTPNKRTIALGLKGASLSELAQKHTEAAVNVLVSVMGNTEAPHAARVSAAVAVLDRGYGKPAQALDHSGKVGIVAIPLDQTDMET